MKCSATRERSLIITTLATLLILWLGTFSACQPQEPAVPARKTTGEASSSRGVAANFSPRTLPFSTARMQQLKLPAGFRVNAFATSLGNPRMMVVDREGTVYVTRPRQNDVITLKDTNGDGVADDKQTVASGLNRVHGIALRHNQLYLATPGEVYVAAISPGAQVGPPHRIIGDLPSGGRHPYRTMAFGPDGMLYLSVGSSCNACAEKNPEHATLLRMQPDGSQRRVFVRGLRNTIGFGWHPQTQALWGMDIGSDWEGGDTPPEELNMLKDGGDYGWPWCYGQRQVDTQMPGNPAGTTKVRFCAGTQPATLTYQAHSSPIGMAFYTGSQFPPEYRNDTFVALRGSWNRKPAAGYKVVCIRFKNGQPVDITDFMTGFLMENGQSQFARVAGVAVARDGALLVSDDENGAIYRISYHNENPSQR